MAHFRRETWQRLLLGGHGQAEVVVDLLDVLDLVGPIVLVKTMFLVGLISPKKQ